RKVRLNSAGNARLLGFDLISQLLQGSADPEAIVRLSAFGMGCLTEPPGGSAVEGSKSLRCDAQATGLQALQQSPHGLFASEEVVHRNQGLKEVKTNGVDMLHDALFPPSIDAGKYALARRVPGRASHVNGAASFAPALSLAYNRLRSRAGVL